MPIFVKAHGSYDKTIRSLKNLRFGRQFHILDEYGRKGVELLSEATPRRTGLAAGSWGYTVSRQSGVYSITWFNTDREGNRRTVNVAVILQYGHGTGTGGYVQGIDYINPALKPLFEQLTEEVWKKVRDA